jgi:hypothetical protein
MLWKPCSYPKGVFARVALGPAAPQGLNHVFGFIFLSSQIHPSARLPSYARIHRSWRARLRAAQGG